MKKLQAKKAISKKVGAKKARRRKELETMV